MRAAQRGGVVFEPESLYRAILYAAALAAVAMTSASRVSELLQVSASRFISLRVPEYREGKPTGGTVQIWVQDLLPKGCKHDAQRQFFLMAPAAAPLLREIAEQLAATHGGAIPIVNPTRSTKVDHLHPEPYLFQWGASPDGRLGLLDPRDVNILLRLLFHRLQVTTQQGEPVNIAVHLLRHVTATHARHVQGIPVEAIQYLLHHQAVREDVSVRSAGYVSPLTEYYSQLPLEQQLGVLYDFQRSVSLAPNAVLTVPNQADRAAMTEHLRAIFEEWGTILPTVFGHCSAPGRCVRANNRNFCVGCSFLVPHWSTYAKIAPHRQLSIRQAELAEAFGHTIDAQQARRTVQQLDDLENVMRLQFAAYSETGEVPLVDTVLPPGRMKGLSDGRHG